MIAQEGTHQAQPVGEGVTFNNISVVFEVDDAVSASSTIESPLSSKQTVPGCSWIFKESLASHRSFHQIDRQRVI